ncbi:MAG: Ig-like domain-containing protein, partial [Lachnospiraceae bacterium]|nr:Ig-like domain-containing protein [Lachnospiraceae bacterium]
MRKEWMKLVAVLLCWAMVFSGTGMTVFAEEANTEVPQIKTVHEETPEPAQTSEESADANENTDVSETDTEVPEESEIEPKETLTNGGDLFTVTSTYGDTADKNTGSINGVFAYIYETMSSHDNTRADFTIIINDPTADITIDNDLVNQYIDSDQKGSGFFTFKIKDDAKYTGEMTFRNLDDHGNDSNFQEYWSGLNLELDFTTEKYVIFRNCHMERELVLKDCKAKFVQEFEDYDTVLASNIWTIHTYGDSELNIENAILDTDFLYCEDGVMPTLSVSQGQVYGSFQFMGIYFDCDDEADYDDAEKRYTVKIVDDSDLENYRDYFQVFQSEYIYKSHHGDNYNYKEKQCDNILDFEYENKNDSNKAFIKETEDASWEVNGEDVPTVRINGYVYIDREFTKLDYSDYTQRVAGNMLVNETLDLSGLVKAYYVADPNYPDDLARADTVFGKQLSFSSSAEAVASVDENGVLTAKKVGSATITATFKKNPEVNVQLKVKVLNPVTGVTLKSDSDTVPRVSKTKFTATVEPATNVNQKVNWSVYAKRAGEEDFTQVTDGLAGVKTVSTKGAVTVGELTVNAAKEDVGNLELKVRATSASNYNEEDHEISDEKIVTLTDSTPVTKVTLTPVASTVEAYSETLIKATVSPAGDSVDRNLTWTVTDKDENNLLADAENGIDLNVMSDSQSAKLLVNLLRKTPIDEVIVTATSVSDPEVKGSATIKINSEKVPSALSFTPAATQTCYGDEVSLTLKPDVSGAYPGVTVSVWKGDQKVTDDINVKVSEISTDSSLKITDPKRSTATITFKVYRYMADEGGQEYTIKAESTVYDLSAEAKVTVKNRYELSDTPGFTLDAGDTKTLKIYDNKQKKYVNTTSW